MAGTRESATQIICSKADIIHSCVASHKERERERERERAILQSPHVHLQNTVICGISPLSKRALTIMCSMSVILFAQ